MYNLINNFNLNLIVRLVIYTILIFVFVYVILEKNWFFTPVFIGLLIAINFWSLFHFLGENNRDLKYFIESVKQRDFSHRYHTQSKNKFKKELEDAYRAIFDQFKKISIEKESHYHLLQTINEQTGAALICFSKEGALKLINPVAKKLIGNPTLKSISDLENAQPELYEVLQSTSIIRNTIVNINLKKISVKVSVSIKDFSLVDEQLKIIHIQNINAALEENETKSWQKLIRVLTHEILNSLTPVVSLTGATAQLLQNSDDSLKALKQIDSEDIQDIYKSILTVQDRSKNLINFVNAFKSISKLPRPQYADIDLQKVFGRIYNLLETDINKKGILLKYEIEKKANYIRADMEMLEQVIINLVFNAIDAVFEINIPQINFDIKSESAESIIMIVKDNGCGIEQKDLEQIFIPFYTTKKKGSGIGLSLVRQIVHLHKGNIQIESEVGVGTKVFLRLPK